MGNVARYTTGADLRPPYDEDLYGRDHPTEADNVYPIVMVAMEVDGRIKTLPLIIQDVHPTTPAGRGEIYGFDVDGLGQLVFKPESDGDPIFLTRPGAPAGLLPGAWSGLSYESTGDAQITLHGGGLDIDGLPCVIDEALVKDLTGLSASAWHYLLAPQPSAGFTLAAGDIVVSTTPPTKDHARGQGWYDGSDRRCIGFFKTDGDSDIIPCYRQGDWFVFRNAQAPFLDLTSPATSLTAIGTGAPALGRLDVLVGGYVYFQGGSITVHIVNGDCTDISNNHNQLAIAANGSNPVSVCRDFELLTDASQQVKYQSSDGTASTGVKAQLLRVRMPAGMR